MARGTVRRQPLAAAVRRSLERRIARGALRPGLRLPPEPELAAELGVSRATLREALRGLEEEGLLRRSRGAGTFLVARPRVANNLDQNFGVTEAIRRAGMRPGFEDASARLEPAPPDEARRLFLEAGEDVAVIERVRTADDRPVVLSRDVLPARLLGPSPGALLRRMERSSIYDVLERQLGVAIHHGVATFTPEAAEGDVAERLRVPPGTLLLYLRQVDYDEEGRPVLSSHEHHLADAFEFTVVRRGPGRRFA
ncbi:MAG TPA: GntR family transcriptional regulator [Actinomycetota bacterium]|nr:GntR family transcriptional regulator [Actinomycetota bacterium]